MTSNNTWVILLVAGLIAILVAGWALARPVRIASAFASHMICSETFISGLKPDQIYAESVRTTPGYGLIDWMLRYKVDRIERRVMTTIAGGFSSRAVFRDGLGCIVEHDGAPTEVRPPAKDLAPERIALPLLPDIAGPQVVVPVNPALEAAVDRAFAEPDQRPRRLTKAVVVVHDGRVVAERYAPGYGIDTPQLGFSATKTALNALLGILVRDGRLATGRSAPVPAWRDPDDPRHPITIDHLLRHTSGLALDETGSVFDPTSRMLTLEDDTAGFAEAAALKAPPGSRWHYASGNYVILSRIIRDALGGNAEAVLRFARRELFDPLGMRSVTLEFDAKGTPLGSSFMFASARDWARLGLLYLDDGVVGGRRILPEGWVWYSTSPTPGAAFGYAAGLWTSLVQTPDPENPAGRGLPPGAFYANGRLGQFILIVPSERLVVVRLGITQQPPLGDDGSIPRLLADVVAALHGGG